MPILYANTEGVREVVTTSLNTLRPHFAKNAK